MSGSEQKKGKTPKIFFSPKGIKVKTRYRLSFSDENRFVTLWSFSARKRGMIYAALTAFLASAILGAILLGLTPLRTVLPGYIKVDDRRNYIEAARRVDSVTHVAAVNNAYMANIIAILNDDIDLDSITSAITDSLSRQSVSVDSLLPTSDAEREFVRQYQQRERFNVSVLSPVAADGMAFFPPVTGASMRTSDVAGHLSFTLPAATPVSATYRGAVIDVYYIPSQGYTVLLQHPNDFLSRYSGLGETFVKKGDRVATGARIGLSNRNTSRDEPLSFELWYNGSQLNPTDYISF